MYLIHVCPFGRFIVEKRNVLCLRKLLFNLGMRSRWREALQKNTTGGSTGQNNTLYWTITAHITIVRLVKQHKVGDLGLKTKCFTEIGKQKTVTPSKLEDIKNWRAQDLKSTLTVQGRRKRGVVSVNLAVSKRLGYGRETARQTRICTQIKHAESKTSQHMLNC